MDTTNISDQIMNVINQIAEKLGVAAEKVYPILRKQAFVEGVTDLIWIIIIIGIVWLLTKNTLKIINKFLIDFDEEDIIEWIPLKVICVIIIVSLGLLFLPSIKDTLTAFINPDWYIFNELLVKLIK